MTTEYFAVGRVRRAHGIRGELVIEALTDGPDAIFAAGRRVFAGTVEGQLAAGKPAMQIIRSSPFKGGWIVAFDGISDRSSAEAWRDRYLLLPESEVQTPSDDELFIHDLPGMRVVKTSGEDIGQVTEVFELPQGLVLEVSRADAKPALLPFNAQTVRSVDSAQRVIVVDPLEGLLD